MNTVLPYLKDLLYSLNIPYAYNKWRSDPVETYWVGTHQEVTTADEDNQTEYTFILYGFSRATQSALEEHARIIRDAFPCTGRVANVNDGYAAIFLENAFPIETDEEDLYRMQINFTVKKWKGR